jgi:hypothetical protein
MGRFKRRGGVNHVQIGIGETQKMRRKRTGPGLGISPISLAAIPGHAQRILNYLFASRRRSFADRRV